MVVVQVRMKRIVRLVSKSIPENVTDIFPRVTGKQPLDPLEPQIGTDAPMGAREVVTSYANHAIELRFSNIVAF